MGCMLGTGNANPHIEKETTPHRQHSDMEKRNDGAKPKKNTAKPWADNTVKAPVIAICQN